MKTRRLDPDEAREAFKTYWGRAADFIPQRTRELIEEEFLPREAARKEAEAEAREVFSDAWRACEKMLADARAAADAAQDAISEATRQKETTVAGRPVYSAISRDEARSVLESTPRGRALLEVEKAAKTIWRHWAAVQRWADERIAEELAKPIETGGGAAETRGEDAAQETPESPAKKPKLRPPKLRQWKAFHLHAGGLKQEAVAAKMKENTRFPCSQVSVGRWIRRVKEWTSAGGEFALEPSWEEVRREYEQESEKRRKREAERSPKQKAQKHVRTVEPEKLDAAIIPDHRAKRQREAKRDRDGRD